MPENTRAALPGDLGAYCRGMCADWAGSPSCDGEPGLRQFLRDCGDALAARDAEIARLRAALERIIAMPSYGVWHMDLAVAVARAALSPPPASDGGEA